MWGNLKVRAYTPAMHHRLVVREKFSAINTVGVTPTELGRNAVWDGMMIACTGNDQSSISSINLK